MKSGVNGLKQKGIQINGPHEEFGVKKVGMGITFQAMSENHESSSGKNKHKAMVVEENQNLNIMVVEGERGNNSLALKFLDCGSASSVPLGSSSIK